MLKSFLMFLVAMAATSAAFVVPIRRRSSFFAPSSVYLHSYINSKQCPRRSTKLSLASGTNETLPFEESGATDLVAAKSPLKVVANALDSAISSRLTGVFLFLTPFLSNPGIRSRINIPYLAFCATTAFAVYVYQTRMSEIDLIVPRRQEALKALRDIKTRQLGSSATMEDVSRAASDYEEVLREELNLRVMIPAVWVLDIEDYHKEENMSAARQFLGLEITEDAQLIPIDEKE